MSLLQLSSSSTGVATRDTGAEAETGAFSEDLAGLLAGPDLAARDLSCRAVELGFTGVSTSPGLKWTWQTHCH